VAAAISELKGISYEEVVESTERNARRLFGLENREEKTIHG